MSPEFKSKFSKTLIKKTGYFVIFILQFNQKLVGMLENVYLFWQQYSKTKRLPQRIQVATPKAMTASKEDINFETETFLSECREKEKKRNPHQ